MTKVINNRMIVRNHTNSNHINMADDKAKLKKLLREFQDTLRGDAKAQSRVKAVNTLLNGGHNLKLLDDNDTDSIWNSIFFALWYSEMGRGCEEIIAAVERACMTSYRLTRIGFRTIAKMWYGLDQYRVDKISHLARHLLPVLIKHQIALWFKNYNRSKRLGTRDISCKKLLKKTLDDVSSSYGLCYFVLEILGDEIVNALCYTYDRAHINIGKFELKANLIVFLYEQVISFVTNTKIDARILRTFDQYVIKKLIEDILPNESQLTQILASLRLYQALDKHERKKRDTMSGKCRELLQRWSAIVQDAHEKCINGEFFPSSAIPIKGTLRLKSRSLKKH